MLIECVECKETVEARLTDGQEIYPHRKDLWNLPFWKCDTCGNYVGCHHKTMKRTKPLGCIPNQEIKNARRHIHALIDPMWQNGHIKRKKLYALLSDHIGTQYHTADLKDIETARQVYRKGLEIKNTLT